MNTLINPQLKYNRTRHITESEKLRVNLQVAVYNSKHACELRDELEKLYAEIAVVKEDTNVLITRLNEIATKYGLEPLNNHNGRK